MKKTKKLSGIEFRWTSESMNPLTISGHYLTKREAKALYKFLGEVFEK